MDKKLKIGLVSDAYYPYPSGVSEYFFCLAKYLRKLGHDVKILTTAYPKEKLIHSKEFEAGVKRVGKVFYIPMNKSYATLSAGVRMPSQVKKFLQEEKFDILFLGTPVPPSISFFALKYSNCPNVVAFFSSGFKLRTAGSSIFRRLFKKYIDKVDSFVAISPAAKNTIYPYIPTDYKIIPCGVDTEKFNTSVTPKKLTSKSPKILYFGRLDRRKGIVDMLKAMPLIRKELSDATLVVAGNGPLQKKSKELAKSLGISDCVFFEGFIPLEQVPNYYAACDVFCSPALGGEAFGIVLIEAMATGKPVAASKITGYDYVIKENYNGLLFESNNPSSLAKTILHILENKELKDNLVANGLEMVKKNYSWEVITSNIEKLFYEIISKTNR
jgi:phosphatidylinositol alpha-mannosyltransferase